MNDNHEYIYHQLDAADKTYLHDENSESFQLVPVGDWGDCNIKVMSYLTMSDKTLSTDYTIIRVQGTEDSLLPKLELREN